MLQLFSGRAHRPVLGKMAEVGQGLRSGATRLSALRIGQSRSVCTRGSTGCLPITDSQTKEELAQDEDASKNKTTRRKSEKLSRVGKSRSQQENASLLCAASLGPSSYRFIGVVETRGSLQGCKTALYLSTGLLQERLLPCRLTPWTRGAVFIHPDAFRSSQQLRAFCTVVFLLAEQGSERSGAGHRRRHLKSDPFKGSATSRSYSWSSDDATQRHRSRTAYYDILKVLPSATQSQIKTAYYKQSFIYHPDKNQGSKDATQRFTEVSEAYTVLGNVSLRRKYDRGILSQSDIQGAGKPSSKEATSRSTGSWQRQQHQQKAWRYTQVGGKPVFDFDAFYRAHYGEQLQRERDLRVWKQAMQKRQKENESMWKQQNMLKMSAMMGLLMGGVIIINLSMS